MSQYRVFVFRENYQKKVLTNNSLNLTTYQTTMVQVDKDKCKDLACKLIASRFIVKNCTSSCARTYLKENYFVNEKNYPLTIVATVALIVFFSRKYWEDWQWWRRE